MNNSELDKDIIGQSGNAIPKQQLEKAVLILPKTS